MASFPPRERVKLVDRDHQKISITRQSELLSLSRSRLYYEKRSPSEEEKAIMDLIDEIYTERPFYGKRRVCWALRTHHEIEIGIKRTRSLMRKMGIEAIGPKPNTSKRHPQHPIYPYLLMNRQIKDPNEAWATDITYIRIQGGWIYLVAIMDWHSRYVLSWRISITLDTDFCTEALEEALGGYPHPEIFNSDQGCQFTSFAFTSRLEQQSIKISMDGRGRYLDNIFIERLWRSLKYEEVYLKSYETVSEARKSIAEYFQFYNHERPHQSHNNKTPAEVYFASASPSHNVA